MTEEVIRDKVLKTVLNEINQRSIITELEIQKPFLEYGIHSVKLVKIMIILENELNFTFETEDFNVEKYKNLENLIEYISNRLVLKGVACEQFIK